MPGAESIIQLRCKCKNDPWGRKGHHSLAARLASNTPGTDFKIDENQYYSEMWMGTYPSVLSYVLSTGEPLGDFLKKNPDLLGKSVVDKFGPDLPFLPKILSMDKALPLQIHPDRELAKKLHEKDPQKFTDTNHKPEIAVALSKFELFAGWKPLNDLTLLFQLKPLQRFMPGPTNFNDETLKRVAQNLLEAPDNVVAETVNALIEMPESAFGKYPYIPSMLDRVRRQYSDVDNGNLVAVVCMNYMTLNPGDSVYVPADGIHAYLSGDIVECMARSDNVLNTGFCPRAERDNVALFTEALSFWPHAPDEALLGRHPSDKAEKGKTVEYAPPISEFHVLATHLGAEEKEVIKPINGPSIMVVTSGDGRMHAGGKTIELKEGYVFFVGQGVGIEFESPVNGMAIYRAYVE
ncbi:hypothetical protein VTN96DRAFT_3780 [Rasamsonia emersonii]